MTKLIIGGSGSGKSEYAENLLSESKRKIYLATMPHAPSNERRIKRHIEYRSDKGFYTIERTRDFSSMRLDRNYDILLEDLPNLLANEMFESDGSLDCDAFVKVKRDITFLKEHSNDLIIVSDDIFSSGTDYDPLTDKYMETLGCLHTWIAGSAELIEVIAGLVYPADRRTDG